MNVDRRTAVASGPNITSLNPRGEIIPASLTFLGAYLDRDEEGRAAQFLHRCLAQDKKCAAERRDLWQNGPSRSGNPFAVAFPHVKRGQYVIRHLRRQ